MRILFLASIITLSDIAYFHFLGIPESPLDVLLNLLCILSAAFSTLIISSKLFNRNGIESLPESPNALFCYGFGTVLMVVASPLVAINLCEFQNVSFSGVAIILFATFWVDYVVARNSAMPKW